MRNSGSAPGMDHFRHPATKFLRVRFLLSLLQNLREGINRAGIAGLAEPKDGLFPYFGIGMIFADLAQRRDALFPGPL